MSLRTARLSRRNLLFANMILSFGLTAPLARAGALYSITDVGPANPSAAYLGGQSPGDPSGNYLGLLSPIQQAAFQAGSFDVYAHPATGWAAASQQNPDYTYVEGGTTYITSPSMVTSNNVGGYAGTAYQEGPGGGLGTMVVTFTADPHTVQLNDTSDYTYGEQGKQSNGYLNTVYTTPNLQDQSFNGSVAGINDHGYVAVTEVTYTGPGANYMASSIQAPHLILGGTVGDVSLGSLGGASGVANALNNSNDVVGWSQTAGGAQHAFLYSNGAMQDLNLLIPPLSGITLVSAVGIDSAGDIVAYGTNASGQMNEYYLATLEVPSPEPGTLAVWALAGVAAAARATWRRPKGARAATRRP